jgi:hypothetical protein
MQRELTLDLEFALVRGASAQPSWAKSADGDDKKPVFIHYEFTAPQGVSRFPPHTLLAFTVAFGSLLTLRFIVTCPVAMHGREQQ